MTTDAYKGPMAKLGGRPDAVAKRIAGALESKRPKARYPVTASARLMISQRRITPDRVWDLMMRSQFPTPRPDAARPASSASRIPRSSPASATTSDRAARRAPRLRHDTSAPASSRRTARWRPRCTARRRLARRRCRAACRRSRSSRRAGAACRRSRRGGVRSPAAPRGPRRRIRTRPGPAAK